MPSTFSITEIAAHQTYPLRHSVLLPRQTLADCVFAQDDAEGTFHLGGFQDRRLVTIASVVKECEQRFQNFAAVEQFRLRGMATATDVRGNGFGGAVLDACVVRCWAEGGEILWCNARTSASEFYRGRGFLSLPEDFEIPGIGPHRVMFLSRMGAS